MHPPHATQHRMHRRRFLQLGGAACLGLALPRLASANPSSPQLQSCILIYYYGGPSQLDTWDLKPTAPAEVRGEFRPIATSVPGVHIGEHLPRTARIMHKLAVIRSMHHPMRNHNSAAVESLCGRTPLRGDLELLANDPNSFPCYGAALNFLTAPSPLPLSPAGERGRGEEAMPAHVALPHVMHNVVVLPGQNAGFLGSAYDPFQVVHDPNDPSFRVGELELSDDVSRSRLDGRRSLLARLDMRGPMAPFQQRAFDLLRSERVRRAFDVARESPATRERYGRNTLGQSMLLARRLVEAGVRFVNVNDKISNGQLANWDSHENNFNRLKDDLLPPADQAFSTLIDDLDERGLLDSTLVIALAEFGRTPRINRNAGRDHWPDCFSIVLAGGGVPGGAVYGTSDRFAAYPASDPVTPGDLAATLFWRFGLDPATELHDITGRPYRLADGTPLTRLFG